MGNIPTYGTDPDGEFLIAALFTAVKIIGYAQIAISTFKAIEQGNWGQAGLNVATFALSGLASKGVNAIIGNASGISAELGRAGLNAIASAGLSKLSGGDFSSGFFRGAVGSLAFSGLGKLQGARNKSSVGNYRGSPCPKGYNCAYLGSITIEAARKGRWRDYIPGWGNGEYYSNPVVKGVHDAGRQFMSHPVTQGAMFVGTSLISGGILNSYKVFNTASLAARTSTSAARLSTNGVKLTQQLASEAQMSQAGRTIISNLRSGPRLAQQYGGKAADWVKKSSSSFSKNGKTFETHWYQNVSTGQRVEFKTKLIQVW